ncbi:MAG: hypothetical protein F2813_08480 [Actinobacteria bacterium]|uniref:Unannotated protein n=1 Tax=freshwater metagenome TaxID=449393 RepID=A0A6J6A1K2_9ZZZZ|nr:hypothetical protein [Actinomycetota bacterium]
MAPGANAPVRAISDPTSDGTRYLGGAFTAFNAWDTGFGALVGAANGQVNTAFPKVSGGEGGLVLASTSDGSGGLYIGGQFTTVGGVDGFSNVAHITADGSVDTAWKPSVDGDVNAVVLREGRLFVGGEFSFVEGSYRHNLAQLLTNPGCSEDGCVAVWRPDPDGIVRALAVSGSVVYAGGSFSNIGGEAKDSIAALDATIEGADVTIASWTVPIQDYDSDPDARGGQLIDAIAISNGAVYFGGDFTVDIQNPFGDATANAAASNIVDANQTGGVLDWVPNPNGKVRAVAVHESTVYLGGEFTELGQQDANGDPTKRLHAAAVDEAGSATPAAPDPNWNPAPNESVRALAISGENVYLGGNFTAAGGQARSRAAAVATDGRLLSGWNPTVNDDVESLSASSAGIYLGGRFTRTGGAARNEVAAVSADGELSAWQSNARFIPGSEVKAIAASQSAVYVGGHIGAETSGSSTITGAVKLGSDGALDESWNPQPDGDVNAVAVSGSNIYLGGAFQSLYFGGVGDPVTVNGAAAVDSSGALVSGWNADISSDWTNGKSPEVNALKVVGDKVFLGGTLNIYGPDDAAMRGVASVDKTTGAFTTGWDPLSTSGVLALDVAGDGTVYFGGEMTSIENSQQGYAGAIGANGTLTNWNPQLDGAVRTIAISGSNVYLGGKFAVADGEERFHAAALTTGGQLVAGWHPDPQGGFADDVVSAIAATDSTAYLGGDFETVAGEARSNSAAVASDGTLGAPWPGVTAPAATFPLTVTRPGSGPGTVTSTPAGIDCGSTCSAEFGAGSEVMLTATAASGSTFSGWSGACTGTATCTVTVSEAATVTAAFSSGAPSNAFSIRATGASTNSLGSVIVVPGAGKATQKGTYGSASGARSAKRTTACSGSKTIKKAGRYKLACKLTSSARSARRKHAIRVTLSTTYTPTGGTARTATRRVVLRKTTSGVTG